MSLLRVVSNEQLDAEEAKAHEAEEALRREAFTSRLSQHINRQWQINRDHRQSSGVDEELLQCLRQRNGEYDPGELAEIRKQGGSEIYMMLTATKCRAASAWISDILLPASDKAWSMEPTPVPDLPEDIKTFTVEHLTAEVQQARQAGVEVSDDDIAERTVEFKQRLLDALNEEAKDACEYQEQKIEDQLTESGFEDALSDFIDDFATFPAAILKGPVYRVKKRLKWGPNGRAVVSEEIVEEDVRVSPFDVYPAPGAVSINDGNLIERMDLSLTDLNEMIGLPGYNQKALMEVLGEAHDGYLRNWLVLSDSERRIHELHGGLEHDTGLIDALHYWGGASGQDLLDWGMQTDRDGSPLNPWKQYPIEAILIGRHVIKATINEDPLARRPYYKASFQRRPGAFWGLSPAQLMRDIQRMCNATARALSNNMGMASGPMAWVHVDRMPQGETFDGFYPWKIFQAVSDPTAGTQAPPVQFFQPQSNAEQLMMVYNQFEQKADDATNIPRYAYGNEKVGGAGQTSSGLAMLLESASKGIKEAIKHIDQNVIEPRIRYQHDQNMLNGAYGNVRGDIKIVARGSSALVAKAATQARRNEFLAITNNPDDRQLMGVEGRAELLRQMVRDMDMPNLIPPDEKIRAQVQAMMENQPQDPALQIKQLELQNAQAIQQAKMEDAERERQFKYILAEMDLKGDMMELAGKREISLEQIKARLGESAMRERGANDRFIAERQIKQQFGEGI